MTVITKTNLRLWLLTGRCDGFYNPRLNVGIQYRSSAPPPEVAAARALLKLSDVRSDFYVIGAAAAALSSAPFLRTLPDDSDLLFAEDIANLPAQSVVGATLSDPSATRRHSISGIAAGREGFTKVILTRRGDSVLVARDDGFADFVGYTFNGSRLVVEALQDHGIDAHFDVSSWADGQSITVNVAQTGYPYAIFANDIRDSSVAVGLMLEEGTMEAFASSVNPLHKVGALACAIIRRMARISAAAEGDFEAYLQDGVVVDTSYALRALTVNWLPLLMDDKPLTYTT